MSFAHPKMLHLRVCFFASSWFDSSSLLNTIALFFASAFSGLSQKCYVSEPSYCCLHKRLELGSGVFGAAKDFLRRYPEHTDAALETLTYFDINNIASCLKVPTDFCLALADPICLPEFVYSAYAHVEAPKQLHIYPFIPHCTPEDYDYFVHKEFSKL